jgi:DnaJ-class molecular chaperone
MKINNITITNSNLDEYYEFSEEEFLGRTEMWCGVCKGKGSYMATSEHDSREWIEIECDECNGTGDIDGENENHECGDWEADEMDFDDDTHVSIDRTCPVCHQLSRLHFWRIKNVL